MGRGVPRPYIYPLNHLILTLLKKSFKKIFKNICLFYIIFAYLPWIVNSNPCR